MVILFLLVMHLSIQASVLKVYELEDFLFNVNKSICNLNVPEKEPKNIKEDEIPEDTLIRVQRKGSNNVIIDELVIDRDHKLMKGTQFNPNPQQLANKGTQEVAFYKVNKKHSLCFKLNPEAPGLEIAHNALLPYIMSGIIPKYKKNLKGMVLPHTEVIVMNGLVFAVSKFIPGKNLEDVLLSSEKIARLKGSFNQIKLIVLLIAAMITLPEDQRPQNCILYKNGDEFQLVPIDTERSFGMPYRKKDGIIIRAHSFYFSLPQMYEKNPSDLFHLSLDNLRNWITNLHKEYEYLDKLNFKLYKGNNESLRFSLTSERLKKIYEARRIINDGFKKRQTCMAMLRKISSDLAKVYAPTRPPIQMYPDEQVITECGFEEDESLRYEEVQEDRDKSTNNKGSLTPITTRQLLTIPYAQIPLNAQQLLTVMSTNVKIVDSGRISPHTPLSAVSIEEYVGYNTYANSIFMHPQFALFLTEQERRTSVTPYTTFTFPIKTIFFDTLPNTQPNSTQLCNSPLLDETPPQPCISRTTAYIPMTTLAKQASDSQIFAKVNASKSSLPATIHSLFDEKTASLIELLPLPLVQQISDSKLSTTSSKPIGISPLHTRNPSILMTNLTKQVTAPQIFTQANSNSNLIRSISSNQYVTPTMRSAIATPDGASSPTTTSKSSTPTLHRGSIATPVNSVSIPMSVLARCASDSKTSTRNLGTPPLGSAIATPYELPLSTTPTLIDLVDATRPTRARHSSDSKTVIHANSSSIVVTPEGLPTPPTLPFFRQELNRTRPDGKVGQPTAKRAQIAIKKAPPKDSAIRAVLTYNAPPLLGHID